MTSLGSVSVSHEGGGVERRRKSLRERDIERARERARGGWGGKGGTFNARQVGEGFQRLIVL